MVAREVFTPEEWQTLQFAPLWVFVAVAGADGKIDKKEIAALAKEISEALLFKGKLVREVLMSIAADFDNIWMKFQADPRMALNGLQEVGQLLDAKSSVDEAARFKGAMLLIGRNIAEASGKLFGPKISEEEKRALVLIAAALKVPV